VPVVVRHHAMGSGSGGSAPKGGALAAGGVASRRGIWWPGVAAPGRGLCSWWQGRLTEPVVTGPTDPDRFASSQPVQIQNLNLNSKNEKNSQYSQNYFKV
jgi:hypothetical protein